MTSESLCGFLHNSECECTKLGLYLHPSKRRSVRQLAFTAHTLRHVGFVHFVYISLFLLFIEDTEPQHKK